MLPKKYLPFVKEFDKWVKKFGLLSWEINFELFDIEDADACCVADHIAMSAQIGISESIDTSPKYLKQCAFHEAVELLLSEMDWIMKSRFATEQDIDSARHKVINTLANVLGAN